jgi:hypothetical protein
MIRDRHRPHHRVAGEPTISFEAMEFQRGNTGMSTWFIRGHLDAKLAAV